jgi:hypothetical protein
VWNVRGLNHSATRFENSLGQRIFSLLCLQENKLDVVTRELVLEMLETDFDYLLFLQFVPCWDPGRLEHRYLIGIFHDFGSHSILMEVTPRNSPT